MSKMRSILSIGVVLMAASIPNFHAQTPVYKPKDGYVPDARTAVRVAEAVLVPIYGAKQINSEKPLSAKLDGDVWVVTGTLPSGMVGGVAEVKISKQTGEIVGMIHGK
jgi:hypothetical protein